MEDDIDERVWRRFPNDTPAQHKRHVDIDRKYGAWFEPQNRRRAPSVAEMNCIRAANEKVPGPPLGQLSLKALPK